MLIQCPKCGRNTENLYWWPLPRVPYGAHWSWRAAEIAGMPTLLVCGACVRLVADALEAIPC